MIDFGYKGKVVFITGGARGFGAHFAKAFAQQDANVVIGDINTDLGEETAASLRSDGLECQFVQIDVREDDSWQKAVKYCVDRYGGFDVLINNAGVEISQLLIDTDPSSCTNLFNINILGTMLGIKHAFKAMKPDGSCGRGGAILNLSSVAGVTTTPALGAYSASKSGVISLTEVATIESGNFKYGVRINALCPSLFDTDMGKKLLKDFTEMGFAEDIDACKDSLIARIPMGRFGEISDVINAGLYLCSEQASFITGVSLSVDGGMKVAG